MKNIHLKMSCLKVSSDDEKTPKEINKVEEVSGLINIDSFKFYRMLGKGSYAKVRVAVKNDTGELFAIKCYNKLHIINKKSVNTIIQERRLLSLISHPFCIYLHCAFQTETELFMVMDLLAGGDLRFHIGNNNKFSVAKARFYMAQIALGIDYLHSLNIIHRDIKPENIGINSKGNAVLMDMGLARRINIGQQFHDKTGTAAYMGPEVWSGLGYGYSADWWSLGVTFYELLVGQLPFELNPEDYKKGIILHPLSFPDYIHPTAADLLSRLLEVNVSKRICCGPLGIEEFKSHPFFTGINFDKLINNQLVPPFVPKEGVAYCDPNLDVNDTPYQYNPADLASYDKDLFVEFNYNICTVNVHATE